MSNSLPTPYSCPEKFCTPSPSTTMRQTFSGQLYGPSMVHRPTISAWQSAGALLKQPIGFPPSCLPGQVRRRDDGTHSRPKVRGVEESALPFKREVTVGKADQGAAAPHTIIAMQQSSTALSAQAVVIVKHRARQALTAVRTIDDGLRLFSWRVNADGSVLRTGSSSAPNSAVRQVQMVHARNYVLACRTNTGELQLSRWDVSNTGAIYPAGESRQVAQQIQWVEMAALTPEQIATLALTEQNTWQLALWQLQGDEAILPLHSTEIPAAAVSTCGLAVLPPTQETLRLATIISETPTKLTLHLWHYRPGQTLQKAADDSIDFPEAAAILVTDVTPEQVNVVVQTVGGQLHLLTWQLPGDGQALFCKEQILLCEGVGHCTWQKQPNGFVLVCRMLTGEIQVQGWQTGVDGRMTLIGAGSAPAAVTGEVISCSEPLEGNAPLLTGIIGEGGEVTLLTWRLIYTAHEYNL